MIGLANIDKTLLRSTNFSWFLKIRLPTSYDQEPRWTIQTNTGFTGMIQVLQNNHRKQCNWAY